MSEGKLGAFDIQIINFVKKWPALYDNRLPQIERSKSVKQALWNEISNDLKGALNPEDAETRWKYLRENYIKARRKEKMKEEFAKNSDTPITLRNKKKKYSFRYYKTMEFLNEALDYQKSVTVNNVEKTNNFLNLKKRASQKIKMFPTNCEFSENNTQNTFEEMEDTICSSNLKDLTMEDFLNETSESLNFSECEAQVYNHDQIFLKCLQQPIEKPSPIDGFLMRLGEGFKRLPYKERSKLELEFLKRLNEVEEQLEESESSYHKTNNFRY